MFELRIWTFLEVELSILLVLGLRKAHEDIANVMLHYLLKLIGSPDLNVISV